jgi:thiol-disulfide isomerase/thioredoxin
MTESRIHAPDFSGAVDWFNVPAPLTLKDLRGKVVLIDFWTYGCINCLHVLPDLRRLEEKYRDELVVVGVHSAKFSNERKSENIRRVLVRYDIDHPVANDANFTIWKAYGARAWPTQVLIDPQGYVVATASGEGQTEALDRAIQAVIHVFDAQGLIDRRPIVTSLERNQPGGSALAFPGKVLADEPGGRLFVADSNHHRVVITDLQGRVMSVVGRGAAGWSDGSAEDAEFYRPQGLALDGETLYVADTENHAVRAIDLPTGTVRTIAGIGRQAAWGERGGASRETPLNSPWDLAVVESLLFVAMAGSHQIWILDLVRSLAIPYAGSGREARTDGSIDEAAFAQPSGLAVGRSTLFVADSESNIIRAIRLPPVNEVRTIAGGDLFDFGYRDGSADQARFQHPLGVAWARERLFVADTYNHRIRTVDPESRIAGTFAGRGDEGAEDGPRESAAFYEPGGVSATTTHLYVADTNNHRIRAVPLDGGSITTLHLQLPEPTADVAPTHRSPRDS